MIIQNDALSALKDLPDESVDCCVTSPPYWGLRDYGLEPLIWNGDENCTHDWFVGKRSGLSGGGSEKQRSNKGSFFNSLKYQYCQKCDAWRGQLGSEPTPELYIKHLVMIFREMKRVLKSDGTFWLNIGDSYAGSGGAGKPDSDYFQRHKQFGKIEKPERHSLPTSVPVGLKPKDMVGIPWMLAFALRADGWYLRCEVIWNKKNPMPESVTDRPTKSHESLFLLSKSSKYYYDGDAIREPYKDSSIIRHKNKYTIGLAAQATKNPSVKIDGHIKENPLGRNKRDVWEVNTQSYKEAHFATMPEKLVEPCILAGTSEKGYCSFCGKPWKRIVEKIEREIHGGGGNKHKKYCDNMKISKASALRTGKVNSNIFISWQPSCNCGTDIPIPQEETDADPTLLDNFEIKPASIVFGVVLDPFAGSGTVGVVAKRHKRDYILIEMKAEYCDMIRKRLKNTIENIF